MSRYRGPKIRILERLGSLPGLGINQKILAKLKKKNRKNEKKYEKRKKTKKNESFPIRLKEKQKLRYNYGLTEKNLINYVRKARQQKNSTSTGEMLLKLLEMRLDNILFRSGYAPTIPAARQLITHGHILLNGKTNNIPSYQCKVNDIISLKKEKLKKKESFGNGGRQRRRAILPYLQNQNGTSLVVKIEQEISRKDVGLDVNELLVIEYYSRNL